MKLYWGPPPKRDSALVDARPWVRDLKKLQAYGGLAAMLVILPLAYVAWRLQWPDAVIFGVFREGPLVFIGLFFAIVLMHESCHLLAQPWLGMGTHSYAGFDPASASPYAGYRGILSRPSMLWILLAPFLLLSVLPYCLAPHFPAAAPHLAWVSIVNAVGSVGDLYYAVLIAFRLPRDVVFQDEEYGRPAPETKKPAHGRPS